MCWLRVMAVAAACLLGACADSPETSTDGGADQADGGADRADGEPCTDASECASGHCGNGWCCADGACCQQPSDCPTDGGFAFSCDDPITCQGTRGAATCGADFRCGTESGVPDDSACTPSTIASDCGAYLAVTCTGAVDQAAPVCATSCGSDADCDPSGHCEGSACVPDRGPGGICSSQAECSDGLTCVDSVCCTSTCGGTCQACNLPGSAGTCTPVPDGEDVDGECGAVSCTGFFHSWSGDVCRRKADVPAGIAACNGAGACRSAAEECAASTAVGPTVVTCQATCQDPGPGTCVGTTPGVCNAVNPGTQTCGKGACANTVNQCQGGAPVSCTPGSPGTETCNGIDDDCDGTEDNGAFSDSLEPNDDCATARLLGKLGSDEQASYSAQTLYGPGDVDHFLVQFEETDSVCGCGSVSTDEDYELRVALTVPAGAGAYEVCLNVGSCGFPAGNCFTAAEGTTLPLNQFLDGACGAAGPTPDTYAAHLRVRGLSAPAYSCSPYTISARFISGLCR